MFRHPLSEIRDLSVPMNCGPTIRTLENVYGRFSCPFTPGAIAVVLVFATKKHGPDSTVAGGMFE